MTYACSILVPPGSPGTFQCVSRCGRRAWLGGEDRESGRSYEHRRQWVEDRIGELAGIFAVAIWGYALMSNHLHIVVQILLEAVSRWSDWAPSLVMRFAGSPHPTHWSNEEVVERWMRWYPRQDQNPKMRVWLVADDA